MGIRAVGDFYVHDRQTSGCTVVTIGGELDVATAPQLRTHLDALVADGRIRLVLDLAELDFLDASGVGVLVRTASRARTRGGWTRLVNVSSKVYRVLRITRLTDALPVYASMAQALADVLDCGGRERLRAVGGYRRGPESVADPNI
jgi:anti-sigma B factor antagonist